MTGAGGTAEESNIGFNIEVAKPPVFNGEASRVEEFIMAYRLYLRMRIREVIVEEQIQWVLLYIQEELAYVWKENVLEKLKSGEVEFESAGEFLLKLKKEFEGGDKDSVKVAELRRIKREEELWRYLYRSFREQLGIVNMKEECWWKNLREE